ncbi:choline kinase [Blastococcus colisei]|uniref:Choline kinase n=1 Tax=Blastococcus colisei TaxID=1564162 RepID=A0A543PBL4_9ACTN|nr:NTP transferase domain-containing protein [Blastococcus colisei]TQN41481.1 choline kinase [Blastococcus colisei]
MQHADVLVVLAAGTGTRLGSLTATTPKWLLDVGGNRVADRQLGALGDVFDLDRRLLVVTGHGAEEVGPFLRGRGLPPNCTLFNEQYATRNNWYSALVALRACLSADTERVYLLNSDLYAPAALYRTFVRESRTAGAGACLAIDSSHQLTDEAMKVQVEDGRVVDIGKVGVAAPVGEYVGMLMLDRATALRFRELLEDWATGDRDPNGWYETVIRDGLLSEVVCRPVEVGGAAWVEIDDTADLERAASVGA